MNLRIATLGVLGGVLGLLTLGVILPSIALAHGQHYVCDVEIYDGVELVDSWNYESHGDESGTYDSPYRTLYLERKEYEKAKAPDLPPMAHHRRAQRYMEKRLLKHLWQQWRRHGR